MPAFGVELLKRLQDAGVAAINDYRKNGVEVHLGGLDFDIDFDGGWVEKWLQISFRATGSISSKAPIIVRPHKPTTKRTVTKRSTKKRKR